MIDRWINIYDWDGWRYRIVYLSLNAAKEDKIKNEFMKLLYRIHVRLK